MSKEIEEMKNEYVKNVLIIGLFVLLGLAMLGTVFGIKEGYYAGQISALEVQVQQEQSANKMLNNQLLTKTLENNVLVVKNTELGSDLNYCIEKYNELYDYALELTN